MFSAFGRSDHLPFLGKQCAYTRNQLLSSFGAAGLASRIRVCFGKAESRQLQGLPPANLEHPSGGPG